MSTTTGPATAEGQHLPRSDTLNRYRRGVLGVLPVAGFALTGARHGTSLLLVLLLVPALSGSVAMVVSQRRRDRRGRRGARARWRAHCDDLLVRAAAAASAQRLALDRLHPDAAGLTAWLQAGFAFERRPGDPDALVVCVGAGEVPCRVPIVRSAGHPLQEVDAELDAQAQAAARATATLACAPVTVGLREVGVLAVSVELGRRSAARSRHATGRGLRLRRRRGGRLAQRPVRRADARGRGGGLPAGQQPWS